MDKKFNPITKEIALSLQKGDIVIVKRYQKGYGPLDMRKLQKYKVVENNPQYCNIIVKSTDSHQLLSLPYGAINDKGEFSYGTGPNAYDSHYFVKMEIEEKKIRKKSTISKILEWFKN